MLKKIIVFILLMPVVLLAQIGSDPKAVYEVATENNVFVGIRAAGMAGAQIAAAEDGSALWYNPALLTRIRRIEIAGSLTHQRFFNQTYYDLNNPVKTGQAQQNKTRISSLWAVFPVPTQQGGLSLAMSINRVKNFDRIFRYENQSGWLANPVGDGFGGGEDDIGSLWAYSFGGGIEISRNASFGASLDLYDGNDNFSQWDDQILGDQRYTYRRTLEDSYSGYGGKIGLAFSAGPYLHLGSVIKFPTSITIEQVDNVNDNGSIDYGTGKYRYNLPFSFGLGGAFVYREFLLSADINYTDYTQLEYTSGLDLGLANADVKRYYRDVLAFSVGAEYCFPQIGLTLRTGFNHDPIPFKYFSTDKDPNTFTGGISYLLDRMVKIDAAISFSRWTTEDPAFYYVDENISTGTKEEYKAQRIYLGFTFRK